ncbi:hypothetical protein SI859A1_01309 [Aurantimonas manganoxydans SI85-9A1]|uniref:Uncharacterized protein n=1 Tax=Aurantimonas manganoxydans (strain ATCC BAA-1229 / DSM 21871 / SI85-9A1) TaxID=287752 RepID=Q1YJ11_AURMS|nr:hypothetical protein SI859A1_01309 [Aurantimonas manganoxydans SI85-9A1]
MRLMHIATAAAISLGFVGLAAAHEFKAGGLTIDHPSSRPTLPTARVGRGTRPSAAAMEVEQIGYRRGQVREPRVAGGGRRRTDASCQGRNPHQARCDGHARSRERRLPVAVKRCGVNAAGRT